jgi:hypothetical protein
MEAPADAAAPSATPASTSAAETTGTSPVDESLRAGETDVCKKGKRLNYQNWEISAIIFGCHAATVAKPQSTVQYRCQFLRDHYEKYAHQCLAMYGLKEGHGGTHTVAQSKECRTVLSLTGKNKGKSAGMGKYQEMISEVVNNILPLYKQQLGPDGKIPSGKTPSEILQLTKVDYYASRVASSEGMARKMPSEMPRAWTDHAWASFVLFGPQGKQFAEFCFPVDDDAAPTSRSAAKAAMLSSRSNKRDFNGMEVSGGMDQVLRDHNSIMIAKMMVKYGTPADKLHALAVLRDIFKNEKENTQVTPSPTSSPSSTDISVSAPTLHTPSSSAMELGPDTGDAIGDDGLTWTQRACKAIYDTKECNESMHGFSPTDVVSKLNGRVSLTAAMEATDFLMLEMHLHTTSIDHHYKSTTH